MDFGFQIAACPGAKCVTARRHETHCKAYKPGLGQGFWINFKLILFQNPHSPFRIGFAMNLYLILFCIASYLLGSVPTGLVLAKLFSEKDIRQSGSGNIGATNVIRVLGKKLGIITFLGDMLKGFLPVFIGSQIFQSLLPVVTLRFAVCAFGFAAFLGHLFSVYLKFRGGKGVATAFGIFLYLESIAIPIVVVLFILVIAVWRYVSLGSLVSAAAMPFVLIGLAYFVQPVSAPSLLLSIVIAFFIFLKHKSNIQRLLMGSENRIGQKE
jgi:glycerol-3-phosphate acyltransferase PlsY